MEAVISSAKAARDSALAKRISVSRVSAAGADAKRGQLANHARSSRSEISGGETVGSDAIAGLGSDQEFAGHGAHHAFHAIAFTAFLDQLEEAFALQLAQMVVQSLPRHAEA